MNHAFTYLLQERGGTKDDFNGWVCRTSSKKGAQVVGKRISCDSRHGQSDINCWWVREMSVTSSPRSLADRWTLGMSGLWAQVQTLVPLPEARRPIGIDHVPNFRLFYNLERTPLARMVFSQKRDCWHVPSDFFCQPTKRQIVTADKEGRCGAVPSNTQAK